MAYPRKGLRKITVDDQLYVWSAKGNDYNISLTVLADVEGGQILQATFPYLQDVTEFADGSGFAENQFVITPYTVREVILLALSQGWKPLDSGKPFFLDDIEDRINLRLEENKEFRIKDRD